MEFDQADSLGSLPLEDIATYLRQIGDHKRADALIESAVAGQSFYRPSAPFNATGLQIGYVPLTVDQTVVDIQPATQIQCDRGLIGSQIKISFDRAYIHEYPGVGVHNILYEFVGRNQIERETEELRMALRYRSADKTLSSTMGIPIFLGVTVSGNGIAFEGRAINISSSSDEVLLEALDGEAFRSGLALMNHVQPGLKPFVSLVQSTAKAVAKRNLNKQVHQFNLGLDFSDNSTSVRLRLGSYIIVQTNSIDWDWSAYMWDIGSNSLRLKNNGDHAGLDFNYTTIGVSSYFPVNSA